MLFYDFVIKLQFYSMPSMIPSYIDDTDGDIIPKILYLDATERINNKPTKSSQRRKFNFMKEMKSLIRSVLFEYEWKYCNKEIYQ